MTLATEPSPTRRGAGPNANPVCCRRCGRLVGWEWRPDQDPECFLPTKLAVVWWRRLCRECR